MIENSLLQEHLLDACPDIHSARLQSIMDVAQGLQKSNNLSLTAMGRNLNTDIDVKHRVKKVDRLEGNKHLHQELDSLYQGLSEYIFKYLSYEATSPIVIDLCFIKDKYDVQMLSAEIASKGRTIPLYRDVFDKKNRKGRVGNFITNLKQCVPQNKNVIIIMDAGFGEEWFREAEKVNWYWLVRIRRGKSVRLEPKNDWESADKIFPRVGSRAKSYNNASIMIKHNRKCRLITKKNETKRINKDTKSYKNGNKDYKISSREPWLLATNLPLNYTAAQVINYYKKRMQIEESFRDVKSHQFGLSARYARTTCINRWGVKLLLAAIVQIVYWVIGIVAHSQNYQKCFQANTSTKKLFSYFYLGKLMVEYDKVKELNFNIAELPEIINKELAREW